MRRWKRICMNLLLPPLVAAILLMLVGLGAFMVVGGLRNLNAVGPSLLLVLFYSYLGGIVPSFLSALGMEWAYGRGLSPSSVKALLCSGLCGAISGLLIFAFIWLGHGSAADDPRLISILCVLGAVTGLAVGVLVGFFEKSARQRIGARGGPGATHP